MIPLRPGSQTQLPLQLVDWCYRKIATYATLHFCGGVCRYNMGRKVSRNFTAVIGRISIGLFTFFIASLVTVHADQRKLSFKSKFSFKKYKFTQKIQ